jgi:hypothetical protein
VDEVSDRFPGLVELLLAELAPNTDHSRSADARPGGSADCTPVTSADQQPRVLVSAAVLPILTILARLQRGQTGSSLQVLVSVFNIYRYYRCPLQNILV